MTKETTDVVLPDRTYLGCSGPALRAEGLDVVPVKRVEPLVDPALWRWWPSDSAPANPILACRNCASRVVYTGDLPECPSCERT